MAQIDRAEWLESFVAVARYTSFSAAAHALHRSQSRVSSHVASLEKAVGHTLIDRSTIPCQLTEKGSIFYQRATEILDLIKTSVSELSSEPGSLTGTVVVGTIPSISAEFIPDVAISLHHKEPNIGFSIIERTSRELSSLLLSGDIDLAIYSRAIDDTSMAKPLHTLWFEPYVAVFPEDSPDLPTKPRVTPEDLLGLNLAVTGAPGRKRDPEWAAVLDAWHADIAPVKFRTEQPQTLINMARSGLLVPVINYLAYESCRHENLRAFPIEHGNLQREVGVSWNQSRHMPLEVQRMIETIIHTPPPAGLSAVQDV
ncbi:MAG: LysR family transcriptional regulator [Actinomycetaceae bacterium]|nr:LysR family transcriptional regulator [Actinomycetaceae bacterium]